MGGWLPDILLAAGEWLTAMGGASADASLSGASFGIVFIMFYGTLAFCAMGIVVLSARLKGFFRGMAYAAVAACLCVAGVTAGLSLSLSGGRPEPKAIERVVVGPERRRHPEMSGAESVRKAIEAARRESEKMEARRREAETAPEQPRRPLTDGDGYPLQDDLSHESSYPSAD